MKSFDELARLLRLGEGRLTRAQGAVLRARRALEPLERELRAQAQERDGLESLLAGRQLSATVVSRVELLTSLRQQAMLRRRLAMLSVERARVQQQRTALEQALAQHLRECYRLQIRQKKIDAVRQRLRQAGRNGQRRLQELETEDLIMSTL